ncbi:MAG: type II toxin-antitoxin system VapC family toxin [Nitriliruptoraceae bacterium]
MTIVVTDASAIVELLRRDGSGDLVAEHLRGSTAVAPAHLDAEVLSALGRLERGGFATNQAVEKSLAQLVRLPIERIPIRPLLARAWQLRQNIALRDGVYVACAEHFEATLLTLNARLARACPHFVELITETR